MSNKNFFSIFFSSKKDPKLAALTNQYIYSNSLGVSADAAHRAIKMLTYLSGPNGTDFFQSIKAEFDSRWSILSALFNSSKRFSQLSRVGTFYPWLVKTF